MGGGECSAQRSGRFTARKAIPDTHCIGGCEGSQSRSGHRGEDKSVAPAGNLVMMPLSTELVRLTVYNTTIIIIGKAALFGSCLPWKILPDLSSGFHFFRFRNNNLFTEQGHQPCFQLPTWRTRSPYLCPPVTGWSSYTPRHWVPFSSSPTTRRARVEVLDPASAPLYSVGW
jgi:hypothetical protein